MRTFWRYFKWFLLGVLSLLFLYTIAALIGSLWATTPQAASCEAKRHEVFITTGGIHLEVVVPVEDIPDHLFHPSLQNDTTTHIAYGWGERNFYLETPTWDDLTLENGAKALLVSSEPLMHVTRHFKPQDSWIRLELCEEALHSLFQYLEASFRKNDRQAWTEVPSEGYTRHDFFYEANGQYHAINTCNTWLNNALKAANVKTARWSPMTYGILWHLED